ncbi:site-specific integrase [Rudanella paleaurantiibacter]|nr:site-specific integrase [Rudanella paleaurantiibacter]
MTTTSNQVKFVLDRPQSDAPTFIILLYRFNNTRLKHSTGKKVHPDQWDITRQRAKTNQPTKKERQPFVDLNTILDNYGVEVVKLANSFALSKTPLTPENFKTHLNERLKPKQVKAVKPKLTFVEFVEEFANGCESGKNLTAQNRRYSNYTIKDYRKTGKVIERYQKRHPERLGFDAFTLPFYERFKKYLTTEGYSLNTIGSTIKNIKILLKQAYRAGYHANMIFRHEDFKKCSEEVDNVYLDEEELQRLYDLDLSKSQKLDRVRDLFLIGCYTGLRFSDFTQLTPENVTFGGQILNVVTRKTGQRVCIPLNPKVSVILHKYAYRLPRTISNQKFNEYLKELAKLAEIAEPVQRSRTEGGVKITRNAEKWEVVTTHTARRSFATNAYRAGIPTIDIMRLTGHKTETSFMRYIKITAEETAIKLLNHPHFRQSAIRIA